MSTNGIIVRSTGEGTFKGVYHHWDSYPKEGLGQYLVEILAGHFKNDLARMLACLIDEHPAGWSTIVRKDFTLKPGYTNIAKRPDGMSIHDFMEQAKNRRPQCFCHGDRHEEEQICDEKSDCGAEWAYVFDVQPSPESERPDLPHDADCTYRLSDGISQCNCGKDARCRILHVLGREKHEQSGEYHWQEYGRIELDSQDEINWTAIECGENFERCGHYAWKHFPELEGKSNLGMQTFLGRCPFQMHDAIGFIVNGKRVKNTGCGGDADFLRRTSNLPPLPPNTWVATIVYENGRRADVPVALRTTEGTKPYPGVKWIFPPTLVNPKETVEG